MIGRAIHTHESGPHAQHGYERRVRGATTLINILSCVRFRNNAKTTFLYLPLSFDSRTLFFFLFFVHPSLVPARRIKRPFIITLRPPRRQGFYYYYFSFVSFLPPYTPVGPAAPTRPSSERRRLRIFPIASSSSSSSDILSLLLGTN